MSKPAKVSGSAFFKNLHRFGGIVVENIEERDSLPTFRRRWGLVVVVMDAVGQGLQQEENGGSAIYVLENKTGDIKDNENWASKGGVGGEFEFEPYEHPTGFQSIEISESVEISKLLVTDEGHLEGVETRPRPENGGNGGNGGAVLGDIRLVVLTQSEFDELDPPADDTLYFIKEYILKEL